MFNEFRKRKGSYLGAGDYALHESMRHSVDAATNDVQAKGLHGLQQKALEIVARLVTNHLDDNLLVREMDVDMELLNTPAARILRDRACWIGNSRRCDQLLLCGHH